PKWEVLYRLEGKGGARWVEVGTLILDTGRLHAPELDRWQVLPARSVVAGAAYGLERLCAAKTNARDLTEIPPFGTLLDRVLAQAGQSPEASQLLRGDAIVLVDQFKACAFLLASGARPDKSPQGKGLAV